MQHIIQFAFDFEDDKVRKSIEQNIENRIISNIQNQIEKEYFEKRWGENPVENMVSGTVTKIISEHKEEIIATAAKMLCERLLKRKDVKEQILGIVEENMEEK